ncbi:hypothetical protein F5B22DRAFT_517938 [Xylaria bambusicola]|uniref:uncharacterized protein n=1 Tax=Xylaria bambusicola TaxID=326684 RepID=UPI0020083B45|nr:uncharacterized protein F5B22DRAFT_517938 [Xylaria bambusicola]KAI0505530.1 hypothetical protein F5B22DRAFT_517938 [Xylaria bambusicola]
MSGMVNILPMPVAVGCWECPDCGQLPCSCARARLGELGLSQMEMMNHLSPQQSNCTGCPTFHPKALSLWKCEKCGETVEDSNVCTRCKTTGPSEQQCWPFTGLYYSDQPWLMPVTLSDWLCNSCEVWNRAGEDCKCGRKQS